MEEDSGSTRSDPEHSGFSRHVATIQKELARGWDEHGDLIVAVIACGFLFFYAGYLGYAMWYEFGSESSIRLLWMSLLGVLIVVISLLQDSHGAAIYDVIFVPIVRFIEKHYTFFKL